MTSEQDQTSLATRLKVRIRHEGPLSVYEYMQACLHDPDFGYYRGHPAIGPHGDFTTAPEISQTFGELIGIWAAVAWRAMGAPARVQLIELGPGRGTMMSDALRAARVMPGFHSSVQVHLVESNARLRETQRQTLASAQIPVTWHDSLTADVTANLPAIVLANEFLDALPVHQYVYTQDEWYERCVSLSDQDCFIFVPGDIIQLKGLLTGPVPREGEILETRPGASGIAQALLQWQPMTALFIDYGHAQTAFGDTLQAVSRHRYASLFQRPGEMDLTAHVDFEAFARECQDRGLAVDGPITQSEFLLGLGLTERSAKLMASARPDQIGLLEAGVQRISDPGGMGGRFKVVCVRSTGVPVLPPFPPR